MEDYNENSTLNLFFGGDFCPQNRVLSAIEQEEFGLLFEELKKHINKSDYSIINLESPIIDLSILKCCKIKKSGPYVMAPVKSSVLLKYLNVSAVGLANNHMMDFGIKGLSSTLDQLNNLGINYCGASLDKESDSSLLRVTLKGKKISIINCCENEFSTINQNVGCISYDIIDLCRTIKNEKQISDYVLLYIHAGSEGYSLPSPNLQKEYHFFIDSGADGILTHHAHCFSGYEIYKNKPIFYGLGNLSFDEDDDVLSEWNFGYCVMLKLDNEDISFEIYPYVQGSKETAGVGFFNKGSEQYTVFETKLKTLNAIIKNKENLKEKYLNYIKLNKNYYLTFLTPYRTKIFKVLARKGLIPKLLSERKKTAILNLLRCESHYNF